MESGSKPTVASLPKSRARMLRLALDAALAVCLVAVIATALVLSKHAFGFLPALPGSAVA